MKNIKESLEGLVSRAKPDIDVSDALDRVKTASTDYSKGASEFVMENTGKVILGAAAAYVIARGVGHYLKRK
ncbi:hypothetical protein A3K72_02525 [Candidatus Woesearchaeota archaeon RBG_13_36_6]|nr:MAG: hypothetical protein A3K72_02525 [Candidatus Woesearchaeota archaeon RBG_13_36_6]